MTTAAPTLDHIADPPDKRTYQRRINAWVWYDWANSAYFTTVVAGFLPTYYSAVAASTLPDAATATQYYSLSLSAGLFLSALIAPVLGTLSDIARAKKRLLGLFTALAAVVVGLLVFVSTGDWLLASVLLVLGRVASSAALVFYDALLPHVARPEDQDRVSSRGFAWGYLGGGILLIVNVLMFTFIPDDLPNFPYAGVRLSFLTVAVWWVVFSFPLFRHVPEPPAAETKLKPGQSLIGVSIRKTVAVLLDMRRYPDLFRYLIAFLIYNDGIGTIIGLAVIYGAELGFGTTELILALLLVQFVGLPFSLMFGNLPNPTANRQPQMVAYILFNVAGLFALGLGGRALLSAAQLSNLTLIFVSLLVLQGLAALFAFGGGAALVRPLAARLTTKTSIVLALLIYSLIATWGAGLDTVLEFWCLAWMIGIVQGGSQALSRSLYAALSPASKSGEYFGVFAVMEKFASIVGPLLFAAAVALFGSSRPAILSLVVLFMVGGWLLMGVNVKAGRALADAEDERALAAGAVAG